VAHSIRVLDIKPALAAYQVGLCTLKKSLGNPLVRAVWDSWHPSDSQTGNHSVE
jgi:LysR family positive regulator for ilvC